MTVRRRIRSALAALRRVTLSPLRNLLALPHLVLRFVSLVADQVPVMTGFYLGAPSLVGWADGADWASATVTVLWPFEGRALVFLALVAVAAAHVAAGLSEASAQRKAGMDRLLGTQIGNAAALGYLVFHTVEVFLGAAAPSLDARATLVALCVLLFLLTALGQVIMLRSQARGISR